MCEASEEMQNNHIFKAYDKIYNHIKIKEFKISLSLDNYYSSVSYILREDLGKNIYLVKGYVSEWARKLITWLPTQEQLYEMIDAFSSYERINRFYDFVHLDADEYGWNKWCEFASDASMSELLFTFVMYNKYHKIWNGKSFDKKKEVK